MQLHYWATIAPRAIISLLLASFLVRSANLHAAEPTSGAQVESTTEGTNSADASQLLLEPPRLTYHQVSLSGDYLIGEGHLSVPIAFGAGRIPTFRTTPTITNPDRNSEYFGGTVSYSYGQAWFVDLSFAHGESEGSVPLSSILGAASPFTGPFKISDDWYEAYFRYAFPGLRGRRFNAYLRAGVTYVQSRLTLASDAIPASNIPAGAYYSQRTDTDDILGIIGFGASYSVFAGQRMRVSLQLEGEGFGGSRSQDTHDVAFTFLGPPSTVSGNATIDNWEYGGLGRFTVRLEYELGKRGLFKIFADAGVQARFTFVQYDQFTAQKGTVAAKTADELLWGPYVRAGFRYSF
jgi:hypothetical protein